MADMPITETVTRRVRARWEGCRLGSIYKAPVWTVGKLEQIAADMRAAGYDEHTQITPQINKSEAGMTLVAFVFEHSEPVNTDPQMPARCPSIAPDLAGAGPVYQCALDAGHDGAHCEDSVPTPNSMQWCLR